MGNARPERDKYYKDPTASQALANLERQRPSRTPLGISLERGSVPQPQDAYLANRRNQHQLILERKVQIRLLTQQYLDLIPVYGLDSPEVQRIKVQFQILEQEQSKSKKEIRSARKSFGKL